MKFDERRKELTHSVTSFAALGSKQITTWLMNEEGIKDAAKTCNEQIVNFDKRIKVNKDKLKALKNISPEELKELNILKDKLEKVQSLMQKDKIDEGLEQDKKARKYVMDDLTNIKKHVGNHIKF